MKKLKNVKFAALMLFVCAVLLCMKPVGVQASTMQTINTKNPVKATISRETTKKTQYKQNGHLTNTCQSLLTERPFTKTKLQSNMIRPSATVDLRMALHSYSLRVMA